MQHYPSTTDLDRRRRIGSAIVLASATAAVAAGVAVNHQRQSGCPVPLPNLISKAIAEPNLPAGAGAASSSDPSVPAAAEVMKGVNAATGEPSPSF